MRRFGGAVMVWCVASGLLSAPSGAQDSEEAKPRGLTVSTAPLVPGDCARMVASGVLEKMPCPVPSPLRRDDEVTWLGWVITGEKMASLLHYFADRPDITGVYYGLSHDRDYQLGLRADGVIVWRPRPREEGR